MVLLFSLLGYEANSGAFAFFIKGRVARHTPFLAAQRQQSVIMRRRHTKVEPLLLSLKALFITMLWLLLWMNDAHRHHHPIWFVRAKANVLLYIGNDPSAGSPTETLLRLLLPLNNQVRTSFRQPRVPATAPAEAEFGIRADGYRRRQSDALTESFNR